MRKGTIDFTLLIVTIILVAYGLLMVLSASYYMCQGSHWYDFDGLWMFKKQLGGAALGAVAMIVFSLINYRIWIKLKYVFMIIAVAFLVLVLIPGVGTELGGSTRWVRVFGVSVQPSEIAKFALIIYLSSVIYVNRNRMSSFRYGIFPALLGLLPLCALLFLQPNASAAIVLCVMTFIMIFVGGASWKQLLLIAVTGIVIGAVLVLSEQYRMRRVLSFMDPWQDPTGDGYQVIQSLYAIGSGGLFGVGLGNGTQKLLWLPFGESDFIFAVIAEELGVLGVALLLILFAVLIYRGIKIAAIAPDLFGTMLATGITLVIALQVVINIAVATSSMPPTGVSLPFISNGSTSLVIMMAMVGILFNISRQARKAIRAIPVRVQENMEEPLYEQ